APGSDDRVLHRLKLLPPRRQFGGRDRVPARHQTPAHQRLRRPLRGEAGRRADLLEEGGRALPGARRDQPDPVRKAAGQPVTAAAGALGAVGVFLVALALRTEDWRRRGPARPPPPPPPPPGPGRPPPPRA